MSFDHYFATYPVAANPSGEPPFYAAPDTPSVKCLTLDLLTDNPNFTNPTNNNTEDNGVAANPFRLD